MNDTKDEKFIKEYIKNNFIKSLNWEGSYLARELIPSKHQYIFSTSIEKDLIHQWTYYGSENSFCIELDRENLISLFYNFNHEKDFYYGSVLYTDNDNDNSLCQTIKKIANEIISEYSELLINEIDELVPKKVNKQKFVLRKVYQYFYSVIKQYGHYCEREYRFLLQNDESPKFRVRKGLFVPYLEVYTEENEGKRKKLPISKIIIGPNNKEEISKSNLEFFLKENGYNDVKVEVSTMRIR